MASAVAPHGGAQPWREYSTRDAAAKVMNGVNENVIKISWVIGEIAWALSSMGDDRARLAIAARIMPRDKPRVLSSEAIKLPVVAAGSR